MSQLFIDLWHNIQWYRIY